MEREPISSLIPPTDVTQPLQTSVSSIQDDSEDKNGGIGLLTLNRIPADSIPDHKDTDKPDFIQSTVILPTSDSIQADIIEGTEDDPEIPMGYQPLVEDD